MENTPEIIDNPAADHIPLSLSAIAISHLSETWKWGKFLSILGFCFLGLMVFGGFFAGSIFSAMNHGNSMLPIPGFTVGFIYLIFGALYFFPLFYLFKFSTELKTAIAKKDSVSLDLAFENLKSLYKYIGIFTLIVLSLYLFVGLGVFAFSLLV